MYYTQKQVVEALQTIQYPGTDKDIITLKMVRGLKIEGKKIRFDLFFQKSNDPNIVSLKKACVSAIVKFLNQNADVKIKIKTSPPLKNSEMLAKVKNVIAVASGKGGVGKSTVASNLAVALTRLGFTVGLIDADIFGPSIPKMFGLEKAPPNIISIEGKDMIEPHEKYGVKMLSVGFFVESGQATIWRGPLASNVLKQMIESGNWGDLDYMLIDLPPGTSDIHLTLVQTVPLTGAIIVSTPQEVALADVAKSINMFENSEINIPVIGLIENMAWFTPAELPDNKYYIFGKNGCKQLAKNKGLKLLGQIPIVQSICESGDRGVPVALDENTVIGTAFAKLAQNVINTVQMQED